MKKRILLIFAIMILAICSAMLFAFNTFAEQEQITISYMTGINSTSLDKTVGTEGTQIVAKGEKITLPTKTVDTGYCLVWATPDGKAWSAGDVVSFDKDTTLYQFKALEVDTIESMKTAVANGTAVKLMNDLVSESGSISTKNQGITNFFMNGHSLTIQGTNRGFEQERAGRRFYGEGEIVFEPNDTSGLGAHLFRMHSHTYAGNNNYLFIGADVVVDASTAILGCDTNTIGTQLYPTMDIYGKVTAYRLLHMDRDLERQPNVNVYEGAEIVLTGPSLTGGTTYVGIINVNISGGSFIFTEENAAIFSANTNSYNNEQLNYFNITGGSFVLNFSETEALKELLPDTCTTVSKKVGNTVFVTVVPKGCNHNYEMAEYEATCISSGRTEFTCSLCQHSYYIESEGKAPHSFSVINDVPATPTEAGVKTYECSSCGKIENKKYSYDPSLISVDVVFYTSDGEVKMSVPVTDIFHLEASGEEGAYSYTITGIKYYGDFSSDDVAEVSVPACISAIRFEFGAYRLRTINIEDGAKINVYSFAKLSSLETINIGAANVTFKKGCANTAIKNILSDKEGAFVTYEAEVFSMVKSIERVTFSTNSDYVLAGKAFGNCTGIKEIILPDYSRPQFTGSAFWENNIEYIYVGRGITSLDNDPFNRNYKLKKAVLMEVNKFPAGWTFCYSYEWADDNDPTTGPAEIYIHSTELSLSNDAFHKSHGITVYTNAPITHGSAFSNCESKTVDGVTYPAYKIVYGIPHPLVEATKVVDTCTEVGFKGYKGDCPCGEFVEGEVTVKVFTNQKTNSNNYEEITYTYELLPITGHKEGEIIGVSYANGFVFTGTKTCICSVCEDEYIEESPSADPLFVFLGYSMPEDGRLEITMGFMINNKAIDTYEKLTQKTVNYGVVLALENKLNGKAPLDSENAQKAELDRKYCGFDLKVSGFTDANKDLAVVMAIYVTEGDTTVYLQDIQTDLPVGVSINSLNS